MELLEQERRGEAVRAHRQAHKVLHSAAGLPGFSENTTTSFLEGEIKIRIIIAAALLQNSTQTQRLILSI